MPQGSCPGADNSSCGLTRPLRRSRCCAFVEGRPRTGRSARAREVPGSERQLGSHGTRKLATPAPPGLDSKTRSPSIQRPARCWHSDPSRLGAHRRPRARPEPVAQPLVAGLLTITFVAVMLGPVSVHYRGQNYDFVLSEVPLLLGLVIAAPAVLVICRVLGEAIRFRRGPATIADEDSSSTLRPAAMSCVVAILVYRALLGQFIVTGGSRVAVLPIGWAAGALALSAAFVYSHFAVTHRRAPLVDASQLRKYGFDFTTVVLVLISSIALALVVLDAAWWDTWAMLPLVTVGALIVFAYRSYLRLDESFRRASAALRLQQVGERPLPRDHGNCLGDPRAGAVRDAVESGGADHRRRVALSPSYRFERRRTLDGRKDDRRQLVGDRQRLSTTIKRACGWARSEATNGNSTSTLSSASSGAPSLCRSPAADGPLEQLSRLTAMRASTRSTPMTSGFSKRWLLTQVRPWRGRS